MRRMDRIRVIYTPGGGRYIPRMIVRADGGQLLLITQPDHAHLAGRIMARCEPLRDHPRRGAILRAVAEHDGGWTVPDTAPMLVPGTDRVADFISAPTPIRTGVWPRGVALLDAEPWAAALVAEHALTVYGRFRDDDAWRPFFDEMTTLRDRMVARSESSLDEVAADYPYVRLGDLISLTFCTYSNDLSQFGEFSVTRDGDDVTVAPDLFGGSRVEFEVEARRLSRSSFGSDAELQRAYADAAHVMLRGSVA